MALDPTTTPSPPGPSPAATATAAGTPGGGTPAPTATAKAAPPKPEGYAPTTVAQRTDWNNFLDYLGKQGLGGSAALDKRDQSLGQMALNNYKKANPNFSITPDMVKNIQYEQYLLRKGDSFPTLNGDQLKYLRNGLSQAYLNHDTSQVDGWLGSLTSKSYYPTATRGSNTGDKWNFGTDFETYASTADNPSAAQKYKVTTKS